MSWSVNNFFKKSQAVKQPHFVHDHHSFKLQRNADLYTPVPSQDYKCRFTFTFTKVVGKKRGNVQTQPRTRPKLENNPAYEVGWNIQDGVYNC